MYMYICVYTHIMCPRQGAVRVSAGACEESNDDTMLCIT